MQTAVAVSEQIPGTELTDALLARSAHFLAGLPELNACREEATAAGDTNVAALIERFVTVLSREAEWLQELAMLHGAARGTA